MAQVIILETLKDEILKKFKGESKIIFRHMFSLAENPNKGKTLGNVAGIVFKELKYKSFRFYFITDGYKLKLLGESNITDLLITFVRMSDKRDQQKIINEIRDILIKIGPLGFK